MEKNRTIPGIHRWFFPVTRPEFDIDFKHITIGEVFSIFFMQHLGKGAMVLGTPRSSKPSALS
jgi:hypothetical protein